MKKLFALLMVFGFAVAVIACGKKADSAETADTTAVETTVDTTAAPADTTSADTTAM